MRLGTEAVLAESPVRTDLLRPHRLRFRMMRGFVEHESGRDLELQQQIHRSPATVQDTPGVRHTSASLRQTRKWLPNQRLRSRFCRNVACWSCSHAGHPKAGSATRAQASPGSQGCGRNPGHACLSPEPPTRAGHSLPEDANVTIHSELGPRAHAWASSPEA